MVYTVSMSTTKVSKSMKDSQLTTLLPWLRKHLHRSWKLASGEMKVDGTEVNQRCTVDAGMYKY